MLDALPPKGLIGLTYLSLLIDINTCETDCESLKKQLAICPQAFEKSLWKLLMPKHQTT